MSRTTLRCLRAVAAAAAVAMILASGAPAEAQCPNPPWPNGCSVPGLPAWAMQGIDDLFLGACDNHDRCWGQCNGPNGPFLGLGHKAQCDVQFLAEMEAACLITAPLVSFPLGDIDTTSEFLETCAQVAATFYAAVATPATNFIFRTSQCCNGCNMEACNTMGLPLPPTCGAGQCYFAPPYWPPIDLCIFARCDGFCVGPYERACCDCNWPPRDC